MALPTDNSLGLGAWERELTKHVEDLRRVIQENQRELAVAEERLDLVRRLLKLEGGATVQMGQTVPMPAVAAVHAPEANGSNASAATLEEAVERILREVGQPVHISNIRQSLLDRNVPLPGRGDEANIIVRLSRLENTFMRTARGTYALAEWKLPAFSKPRRRRRGGSK